MAERAIAQMKRILDNDERKNGKPRLEAGDQQDTSKDETPFSFQADRRRENKEAK